MVVDEHISVMIVLCGNTADNILRLHSTELPERIGYSNEN